MTQGVSLKYEVAHRPEARCRSSPASLLSSPERTLIIYQNVTNNAGAKHASPLHSYSSTPILNAYLDQGKGI